MKQQGDTIQRLKDFTSGTISNLRQGLIQHYLKSQASACTNKVTDCIDSFEALILCLLNEMGEKIIFMNHKVSSVEGVIIDLRGENQKLQEKLAAAQLLVQQKNLQIELLNMANFNLRENIVVLQSQASSNLSLTQEQSEDSLQNIDSDDLEFYQSECDQLQQQGADQVSLGDNI